MDKKYFIYAYGFKNTDYTKHEVSDSVDFTRNAQIININGKSVQ